MEVRVLLLLKFALVSTLTLCVLPASVRTQFSGCSLQGIDLDKCLNQDAHYDSLDHCCKALNQAIQVGFHCLCSLLALGAPHYGVLLPTPLTSCYLWMPPLALCGVVAPMPVVSPPEGPNQLPQPSAPASGYSPSPKPLQPPQPPLNSTTSGNYTMEERDPHSSEGAAPKLNASETRNHTPSAGAKAKILSRGSWLLSLSMLYLSLELN
ncbi:hypothetical protein Ancab_030357 [Ancistrocladus abbreviatus]